MGRPKTCFLCGAGSDLRTWADDVAGVDVWACVDRAGCDARLPVDVDTGTKALDAADDEAYDQREARGYGRRTLLGRGR